MSESEEKMDLKIAALKKDQLSLYRTFLINEALERIPEKEVHILGALADGKLVGVLAFAEGEPARLLSIAVTPEYQRKGIGSALVDELSGRLINAGTEGMDAFLFEEDEQAYRELSEFLYYCGFMVLESFPDVIVSLGEVAANREFSRTEIGKKIKNTRLLSELSELEKKKLGKLLSTQAGYHYYPRKGLLDSVSCVYEDKGEMLGCVLMGEKQDDLELQFVFLASHYQDRAALFRMMCRSLNEARAVYGDEKKLRILALHETAQKIVEFFFSESEGADILDRFYLPFRKSAEEVQPAVREEKKPDRGDSETEYDGEKHGAMSEDPQFRQLTNADMICRDCIYRILNSGAGRCHKYTVKPSAVVNGGKCPKYRKEKEG